MKIKFIGKALCITKKYDIVYRKGKIYVYQHDTNRVISEHQIFSGMTKKISNIRIIERLLRLEPRCAIALENDEFLISCNGAIYCLNVRENSLQIEHRYRKEMKNPLNFSVMPSTCEEKKTSVLYGEYIWNENHDEVKIWIRENGKWSVFGQFPSNSITHIHQVQYNSYRNELLIATGDSDTESGIWRMDIHSKIITPIISGKQEYRSCSLLPVENGIIYVTDTPLEENGIFYYDYNKKSVTKVSSIPGPCIYSTLWQDSLIIATSVEPDSRLKGWKYRLTNRLGVGVEDRFTHIMKVKNEKVSEITRFEKDKYKMLLFQFGNCQFPNIDNFDMGLYLTPCAVKKYDGKTVYIDKFNLK